MMSLARICTDVSLTWAPSLTRGGARTVERQFRAHFGRDDRTRSLESSAGSPPAAGRRPTSARGGARDQRHMLIDDCWLILFAPYDHGRYRHVLATRLLRSDRPASQAIQQNTRSLFQMAKHSRATPRVTTGREPCAKRARVPMCRQRRPCVALAPLAGTRHAAVRILPPIQVTDLPQGWVPVLGHKLIKRIPFLGDA